MQQYPHIDDFGEINWRYQPRELVRELSRLCLASYDWAAKAYITQPVTVALVQEVTAFARRHDLTIHPNREYNLSIEQPQALVDYFFLKRLELSQSDSFPADLGKPLQQPLTPYIKAAVVYAVHARNCFIADPDLHDRQLAALAAVHQVQGYPCVLVCREQERDAWQVLITRYLPPEIQFLEAGAVDCLTPAPSIWRLDYRSLERGGSLPPDAPSYFSVIVDHAHFIKNPQAQRTRRVAAIARRVNYRFLVTDFPVNLSPVDLREPLHILGKQSEFDTLDRFLEQVTANPLDNREIQYTSNTTYQRKLSALYRKLRATCLVRRADDPGLRSQEHIQRIEPGPPPERIDPEDIHSELRRLGLQKVNSAINWLRRFLAGHPGKVLVVAHHNDVVEEIAAVMNIPTIYGKIADEDQRREIAANLASPDGVQALVVAGDVELGWDLGMVSALVFVELLITPRQLHGFVEHILGQGQDRVLPVHLLYSGLPLDWEALKRLELRLDDYDLVVDGLKPGEIA